MPDLFEVADASIYAQDLRMASSKEPLHLISLNIQSAGKDRLERILEYLTTSDPDLIILSEVKKKRLLRNS